MLDETRVCQSRLDYASASLDLPEAQSFLPVRSSVRVLPISWTRYFENEWTDVTNDPQLLWSVCREVEGQDRTMPKLHLEVWPHSRPLQLGFL